MALSQKHVGKSVVPWFSRSEWNLVCEKIYGTNHTDNTRKEALDILRIWKARTPLLPRGVEGTFIILQALSWQKTEENYYNIQLLLSTSIMRFLNICAAYDKNQGTFYQVATKINLPEWLINLRHEIAHGQFLPSLDILNRAVTFCLNWLYTEYWLATAEDLKDFIDETQDKYGKLMTALQPYVNNYCYTILLTHPFWNFTQIHDLVDIDAKNMYIDDIRTLTDLTDVTDAMSFVDIQNLLLNNIEQIINNAESFKYKENILPELLVQGEIFLAGFDERTEIFKTTEEIPVTFLKIWENLFILLQQLNMLGSLIETLLNFLTLSHESHERKLTASWWLLTIAKGLIRCVHAQDIIEIAQNENCIPKSKIKSTVTELLETKYNNENIIKFNYYENIPDIILDTRKFNNFFLENPNNYTKIFISEYLDLNDLLKKDENKKQILDLLNNYLPNNDGAIENCDSVPTEIYSVENVTETLQIENKCENSEVENDPNHINQRWIKRTGINFENCPLGILPWQKDSMNTLL